MQVLVTRLTSPPEFMLEGETVEDLRELGFGSCVTGSGQIHELEGLTKSSETMLTVPR